MAVKHDPDNGLNGGQGPSQIGVHIYIMWELQYIHDICLKVTAFTGCCTQNVTY